MAASPHVMIDVDGREVKLSNPDKVMFPRNGQTKHDLVDYYLAVAAPVMTALAGRPILMERYPNGANGKSFFQKRVPESRPDWLETTIVSTPNGTLSDALVAADMAHLIWAVNLGCLGFHVWPYQAADAAHADELRIDLDPFGATRFDDVRRAAHHVRVLCDELGIEAHPKSTASKGIHVYVALEPRWSSYEVRAAAVALARELERRHPTEVTAAWWKEERGDRVFVDFNQNAPHKTVFGAWSARSRVGAQVSTPLRWEEIDTVMPDELTIDTVPAKVAAEGDPWGEMRGRPQSIEPLLAMSAADMANGLMDAPWPPVYPKQPNEPPRVAPSRAAKPAEES